MQALFLLNNIIFLIRRYCLSNLSKIIQGYMQHACQILAIIDKVLIVLVT